MQLYRNMGISQFDIFSTSTVSVASQLAYVYIASLYPHNTAVAMNHILDTVLWRHINSLVLQCIPTQ